MKSTAGSLAAIAVSAVCCTAYALYSVSDTGDWPDSWPDELESLREHSLTFVGPHFDYQHFAMRFDDRDTFEAAWPHILKVKSEGAPIILVRGENFFLGEDQPAGVIVHSPPAGQSEPPAPIPDLDNPRVKWMHTNYIELVVDGEVVDLNRLQLPPDTPIIDERFAEEQD